MTFNVDSRYLIWFENNMDENRIKELETKLKNLGVHFEIINGLKRPAIVEFGKPRQLPIQKTTVAQ